MDIRSKKEEFSKAAENITKELAKPEQKGLMAAPQPEQEEIV